MKKINKKYKKPLFISMMMPTMICGLPAVHILRAQGFSNFFETWISTIKHNAPISLCIMLSAALFYNFILKFIIED